MARNNTYLIVGLGNPDKKYENTFHNVGKLAIIEFAKQFDSPQFKESKRLSSAIIQKQNLILAHPLVYMNESGGSIRALKKFFKTPTENIIIIHDDGDLPFGKIKISFNRGAGGHKGIESIINKLKTQRFVRIRIGIQPTAKKRILAGQLVLEKIDTKHKKLLEEVFEKVSLAIEKIVSEGLDNAMREIN